MTKVVTIINIKQFLGWITPGVIFVAGWFLKQGYDLLMKWHHTLPILALSWISIGSFLLFISDWIFVLSQSILIKELQDASKLEAKERQSNESIATRVDDLEKNVTTLQKAHYQQNNTRI